MMRYKVVKRNGKYRVIDVGTSHLARDLDGLVIDGGGFDDRDTAVLLFGDQDTQIGRPSDYSQELADDICSRLAVGESMRSVSRSADMPSMKTMFSWMRIHDSFLTQYTCAKQESADAMAEESLDIADDGTNDWMERHDANGNCIGYTLNGEHVQRSKLRIETRKWYSAKLKPKKYGEKLAVGGTDDLPPIKSVVLDKDQYAEIRKQMLADDDC